MKRLVLLLSLAACAADDPTTNEVVSAGTSLQGTSLQGTSLQGTSLQGTSLQGTSLQGTSLQGATYGNTTLSSATVNGTTLSTWTFLPNWTWQQRLPNQVCTWNFARTSATCLFVNLATSPSPLAGTRFPATFVGPNGTITAYVQIGTGTTEVGAVNQDTSTAMFDVGNGTKVPHVLATDPVTPKPNCTNPNDCRQNNDLWLYEVHLIDPTTGKVLGFCTNNQPAYALAGTWDATGTFSPSNGNSFTFACTTGTIAKCTKWGYRPWGGAIKSDGTLGSLEPYHQACIRAARADYCANGNSWTKNGTLVDVYDYNMDAGTNGGFIPWTQSVLRHENLPAASALMWESTFDQLGGLDVDFYRYSELAGTPDYPALGNPDGGCPDRFGTLWGTAPEPGLPHRPASRNTTTFPETDPLVFIDTTSACDHTELKVGKALNPTCSVCTYQLWVNHNGDDLWSCISWGGAWDASCVAEAKAACGGLDQPRLEATHNECTAGTSIYKFASGCSLNVCSDPAYASCCTSSWTSACVAQANNVCVGGQEHFLVGTSYGFCNTPVTTSTSTQL